MIELMQACNFRCLRHIRFPTAVAPVHSIFSHAGRPGSRKVFGKSRTGNDTFNSEKDKRAGKGWVHSLKTGSQTSSLSSIPADKEAYLLALKQKKQARSAVHPETVSCRQSK
jgi:hypothetical protein